jgi:valyl-tRNA synthetase
MDKNYDHKKYENSLYKKWEESGSFAPPAGEALNTDRKTYTVIMPPPNANDPLHIGHACFVTIEDILVRFHRMLGEATLWLPGTDHAGIETQFVFEKKLAKEGKSRFDYDRETLYSMIWNYVQKNSDVAVDQMKKLGASADWSRQKFTLDENIVDLVLDTFIELNKRGLVYKAERLVNFCTKCGTAYSELEVEYEERTDKIYTIDYGNGVKVATTRPETLLGDVAVAVNPLDTRYKNLIGIELDLPLTNRKIKVIGDETVDMEFGTGAVKVTPTHDKADWETAERADMDLVDICSRYTVIGESGKMNQNAGRYVGLSIANAREEIVKDLGEKLVETKDIVHNVGTCYRCHRVIEPLPKSQFFIKVRGMADKVLTAMNNNEFEVLGSGHDKILRHWLENLRDWNVSRQIVWGIRMPVWYKTQKIKTDKNQNEEYLIQKESPGEGWVQETDTFDTWFSSGQWPFVTLKTNKEKDFEKYYPTQLMETAYDILPFWVMRMLMLGIEMTGKVPFKTIYLHGLVRDEKGQKMSKSKGNVINPLELSEKYGTDALRMALVMSTTAGVDSATGESKVRGMRNFANKIWNAGRFIQELKNSKNQELETGKVKNGEFEKKMNEVVAEITKLLNENRVGLASETVYNEFWHWFCDEQIESCKKGEISAKNLNKGYKTFIKLLHPFVPFVTEAVWKEIYPVERLLILQDWPHGFLPSQE